MVASFNTANGSISGPSIALQLPLWDTSSGGQYGDGPLFRVPIAGGVPQTLLSDLAAVTKAPIPFPRSAVPPYTGRRFLVARNGDGSVFALNLPFATVGVTNVVNATIISGGTGTLGRL